MPIIPKHISLNESTNNLYILTNDITQTYIKVGEAEVQFLSSLYKNEENVNINFTNEQRQYLYENFKNLGFLSEEDSYNLMKRKSKSDLSRIYLLRKNPSKFFENNQWIYKGKHVSIILFLISLLILASTFVFFLNIKTWSSTVNLAEIDIKMFVIMYILIMLTLFIHEFAHALACYYFGGKVKEVGAMLLYMGLAFYCDVSSIYLFKKKSHRLLVLLAGIFSQLFLGAIAIIICCILFLKGFKIDLILYYIAFNFINILLNLSPVIKLDGYWILVQLTDVTNLREKSFKYILSYTKNTYKSYRAMINKKEKKLFFVYGTIGVFGTYFTWLYSVYYLYRISNKYLGNFAMYLVAGWLTVLIFHLARKFKKYTRLLKNDITYK
ncbi:putative peptide zinc metalloprotease protein [Priestia megaterium]